jgi:hypothetical protein
MTAPPVNTSATNVPLFILLPSLSQVLSICDVFIKTSANTANNKQCNGHLLIKQHMTFSLLTNAKNLLAQTGENTFSVML